MRNATLGALGILIVSSWGCLGEPQPFASPEQLVTESSAVVDGTPEAVGLLGFLNASETTFEVLDKDVPLDRRAAEHLIAHRDGPDGVLGTADDDPYDDVAEVDGVKYVGPASLDLLIAHATAEGYVPEGADLLGLHDGVAFTVDEAAASLALANTAPATELDDDVGLDSRAVDSIVAAREIVSMPELAALYFVGQAALLKLREYPKTLGGTKGIWEDCAAHAECASGLCAGLIAYGSGWCFEAWQADTFTSTTAVAIPDDGTPVTSEIVVAGMATVPLDVIVTLDIDHPRPQDLLVALHQPGGAYAVLWDHQASPPPVIEQPSGLEGDNMVNGTWTLDVIDTVTGQAGTVNGWSMWISSNFD